MLDTERICMGRLKLRLSQKRLGELIGQDPAYVSRLERGGIYRDYRYNLRASCRCAPRQYGLPLKAG